MTLEDFIEAKRPFTQDDIDNICQFAGRALPKEYCDFVMKNGGAFVGGLVDGSDELPIDGFCDVSRVMSILSSLSNVREAGAIPFADCVLGNLWVFDEGNCIHYINFYGGKTKTLKGSVQNLSHFAHATAAPV